MMRFTPTGVGTIITSVPVGTFWTVHPHGRGDNHLQNGVRIVLNGSPPRAWGQLNNNGRCHNTSRFTPTGVGTISSSSTVICGKTVHPHGRGDNTVEEAGQFFRDGSPPRAWGQSFLNYAFTENIRFTPTGVGTICAAAVTTLIIPVHPHGRGDNRLHRQPGAL